MATEVNGLELVTGSNSIHKKFRMFRPPSIMMMHALGHYGTLVANICHVMFRILAAANVISS
jgi:hypothetical protein